MAAKPKPSASALPSGWAAGAGAGPGPSGPAAPAKADDKKGAGAAAAAAVKPEAKGAGVQNQQPPKAVGAAPAATAKPAANANAKWACAVCTVENEAADVRCSVCGADKSGTGAAEGDMYSALEFFPMFHDNKYEPLITPPMVERLYAQLPASLRLRDLKLLYSIGQHGASLETLYRQCVGKGPTLLIVKDDKQHVFGAFLSESWQPPRKDYYGNGLTFVMRLAPTEQPVFYKWHEVKSGNSFYHLGKDELIGVGGGDGFAIAIGKGLREGSSKPCATFNSPSLSGAPDFKVHALEVWGFQETNHADH